MKCVNPSAIHREYVKDITVFNIELESTSMGDDLYVYDPMSKIIHHNCLRKDFGMIAENTYSSDLAMTIYRANEYLPAFIISAIGEDNITGMRVGIYGWTFKKDSDDVRDSLSTKIASYILKNNPQLPLHVYDPYITQKDIANKDIILHNSLESMFSYGNMDIMIIATNHTMQEGWEFHKLSKRCEMIVDPWNILDGNKLVQVKGEDY